MMSTNVHLGRVRNLSAAAWMATSAALGCFASPSIAQAQWSTTYEQYYLPGKFNFTFRRDYPAADRLFNAFDYGHAILYERLYNDVHAPASGLEVEEFNFITRKLLVSPPRLPLAEAAIEVNYAKMAPEAKAMFDWAHLLHRQIYDVLATEGMSPDDRDARIAELVAYYKTRPDLAFSSVPKNMDLMEGQPYSLAFRHRYPKFNGLIWGYHWLQVGLYEPLMIGHSQEERQAGVAAAVSRFRQMLENAPEHMPRVMPMTATIAPTFARRYPEVSIIFDNLHAMHDVVSDILANDAVPKSGKRAAILEAASRYRDDRTFLMPVSEWATMGEMMGIENMGGPAVGILPGWTAPTIPRGTTMAEAMKRMPGMGGMAGMAMGESSKAGAGHSPAMSGMNMGANDSTLHALQRRMMNDPVIHAHMMADTAMRRMMSGMAMDSSSMQMMHGMPAAGHDMHTMQDMPVSASAHEHAAGVTTHARVPVAKTAVGAKRATRATSARKKATSRPTRRTPGTSAPPTTPARKPPAKPAEHDMPGMKMPGMKMPGMNMPDMKP